MAAEMIMKRAMEDYLTGKNDDQKKDFYHKIKELIEVMTTETLQKVISLQQAVDRQQADDMVKEIISSNLSGLMDALPQIMESYDDIIASLRDRIRSRSLRYGEGGRRHLQDDPAF